MNHIVSVEFTKPDKWFQPLSWIIRKVQRTEYSHVRLRWKTIPGPEIIYEASGSEVKMIGSMAIDRHPVKIIDTIEIPITREEYKKLIGLFKYASVKYGKMQLIGMFFASIIGLSYNPLGDGTKSQVCSELIAHFCKEVKGWDIGVKFDLAGPKEIHEFLINKIQQ